MMNWGLRDKVILITGASGYFGKAISTQLALEGVNVVISGRNAKILQQLEKEIKDRDGLAHKVVLDLENLSTVSGAIDYISSNFGRLDGIVNNAYSGRVGDIERINHADFQDACVMNLSGPFELIKAALPLMEETAKKYSTVSIVNIASMYGHVSPDHRIYDGSGINNNPIHYGATKAGLIQMTRYLACNLAEKNIRVNSISPGAFPPHGIKNTNPEFYNMLKNKIPLGRIGNQNEIVGPVIFLLSDLASYMTGSDIPVDGGWTAW